MAICPNGHDSASDDFCDVCGMRVGGAAPPVASSPATGSSPPAGAAARPDQAAAESCPRCATPRTGQFCESCGFNFSGPRFTPASPPGTGGLSQAELAEAIQEGLEARKQGDEETATAKLGRAVALAHQSGNEDTAKLLAKVVVVVDVESGTIRLKKKVEDADEMALDTRSTKTVRVKK